jgi:hypothetical protein
LRTYGSASTLHPRNRTEAGWHSYAFPRHAVQVLATVSIVAVALFFLFAQRLVTLVAGTFVLAAVRAWRGIGMSERSTHRKCINLFQGKCASLEYRLRGHSVNVDVD